MVWFGMVWYGMVGDGMIWYDMVWFGMVWYGVVSDKLREVSDSFYRIVSGKKGSA